MSVRRFFPFFLILFSSLIYSCGSQQRVAGNRTDLSRKLGFEVSKKDDVLLMATAAEWLGTPYQYGGNTRKGIDCSGLVCQIYKKAYQTPLERSTSQMAAKNCRKISKGNLSQGDLVFFNTAKKGKGVNHVGIFLKKGYFVHASSSRGVIISHLEEDYYRRHWKTGGKVKK